MNFIILSVLIDYCVSVNQIHLQLYVVLHHVATCTYSPEKLSSNYTKCFLKSFALMTSWVICLFMQVYRTWLDFNHLFDSNLDAIVLHLPYVSSCYFSLHDFLPFHTPVLLANFCNHLYFF